MTEATDLQLAQTTDETVTEEAVTDEGQVPAEGQQTVETEAGQEVPVNRPPAGQTTVIEAAPAARYVIGFDANEAQVQIDGNDFILLFDDGGRIVFANLVLLASGEQPPSLLVGGTAIGGDLIVAQATSQAGQAPTLETAAGNQPGQPIAGGSHEYGDDLGSLIAPLIAQPDIPYVERDFGLIDLEPITPTPLEEEGEPVLPSFSALPSLGTVSEQFLPPRSPSGSQFDPAAGPGTSTSSSAPNVAFSGTLVFDTSNAGVITSLQLSDGTVVAPVGAAGASETVTYAGGFSFGPVIADEGDFLFTTPLGNLLFVDHETGEYLYVLADNEAQPGVGLSGDADTVEELFTYTATNSFGQTASATLTIDIEDDAPTAVDEATLKVYENGTVVAPDSVLENDTEGADGSETVTSIGVTGAAADQVAILTEPISITGTYGTLTINSLGEYSYTADDLGDPPPANPIDTFVYTIVDEDGDSSQAVITIVVKESPNGGIAVAAGEPNAYVPEDVPTDLTLTADTGGSPLDPNDGLTSIVVDFGTPIDLDGSDPETQWQLDPADLAAILALPEVTAVTLADGGSVLTITLDGTTQSFSADLTVTTPDDSDVDMDGVTVTVTAVDNVFGSTGSGTSTNDITADAIVDGSEVFHDGALIDTGNNAVGTTVDTAVNLDLTLELGPDSTDQDSGGDVSQGDTDGSTLGDDTEEVSLITVTVDQGATLSSAGAVAPTVTDQGGGVTLYSFDTAGLTEAEVNTLVASFTVTPATGVIEDITVVIETTTRELNTPPDTTLPASGDEANIADNVDVDTYALTIKIVEDPSGKLEPASGPDGFIPEDVPTDVTLTATVGDPTDPNQVLTEIVVDFGTPIDTDGSDPETQWQLDPADLAAILALPEVTGVTLVDGTNVLTITLNGTTQTFSADMTMTTPDDSDVDLDGVIVTVTAADSVLGTEATGTSTNDITADAIVDGSEVLRNGSVINSSNNMVGTNINAAVLLGLTLELGPDSTDQDSGADVSQGDTDGSTLGDDTEEVILVTVQVDQGAALDASTAATSTTDLGGGVTLYSFDTSTLSEAEVSALVASFEVSPALDSIDDISVTITTTTREENTPPDTTLAASGDEADIADNVDVDTYVLTVKIQEDPSGKLEAASSSDGYIPEDVPTDVTLSATVGDLTDPNQVLTSIVVDFGTAIDLDGSDPETQWQLDPADLAAILALPEVTAVTLADGGSVLTITLNGTTQTFSADMTMTTPLDSDVDLDGVIVTVTAADSVLGTTATGTSTNDVIADAIVDGTELIVTAAPTGLQNQFVAIDLNTELVFGEDSTNVGNSTDPSQADVTDGSTADDLTEFVSSIVVEITDKDSGTPTGTLEFDSPLPTGITVTEDAATNTWTFEITSSVSRADVEGLVESFSVKPVFNYSGTLEVEITTTTEELNTPPGSTLPASGDEANVADNVDIDTYSIDVEVAPVTVHKQVDVSGGEPKPFNICFIIDRSGSMGQTVAGSGGQTRFEIAEDAFRTLIADIRDQGIDIANIRILGFNTGTLDVSDFDHLPTDAELDAFFDDLGSPNGGTRYEPPLQSAAQFLSSINDANPDVEYDNRILFLSDGGNNNSAGGFLLGTSNGNDNAGAYDDIAKLYGNAGDVGTDIPNLTIKSVGFGISKSFAGDAQQNLPTSSPVNAYLALDQSDDNMVNGSAIVSNANNGADLAASFGSVVDPSLVIGTLFEGHTFVGDGELNTFAHLAREYDAGVAVDNADRDAAAAGDVVANDGGVVTIKTENGGFLTVWFVDDGGNLEGDFRYEGPPNYPGDRMDTITYVVQDDVGLQLGQLDVNISGQAPANGDFENGNLVDWDYLGSVYIEDNADLSSANVDGDDFVAVLATNNANGLDPRDAIERNDEGVVEDDTLEDGNLTPVEDLGKEPDLDDLDLYEESDLEAFLASNGAGANVVDLSTLVGDDVLDGAVIQTSFELDPLFGTAGGNQDLSITFDWNFATDEAAGGQNDIAFVVVEGQLFLLGSVDGSTFSGGALDVGESEITYDRSTGWQTTTLNLGSDFTDVDGDNVIHVAFGVADAGFTPGENSALLIDNVQADVS